MQLIDEMVRAAAFEQAERNEAMARAVVVELFPRSGRWLCEHPKALALVFRMRPSLRPSLVYEVGRFGAVEVRR